MKRLIVVAVLLCGCTSQSDAARALKGAGYTDIQMTGYQVFSCSEDDTFHTGFSAKGPSGARVSGTVCSGWFKGSTIRTD